MLDWQKNTRLRIFFKIICIVLIFAFVSYDLVWAGAAETLNPRNWQVVNSVYNPPRIEIPQELGIIKDSYQSKHNPYKLVIHIQDAHANLGAQENEAKIIKYLKNKYDLRLVSVEGGFGDFDAGFFRSFPKDKGIREKIAKYFLRKSFISGADYLLLTEDNPPALFGAEEKTLYTKHLDVFRQNQSLAASLNNSLNTLSDVIKTLKNRYYPEGLIKLDSYINDFKEGRISLEDYISYLNISAIINRVDLSGFPNLSRIIGSQELNQKIDFAKAESERQDLIDSLSKSLSKDGLEELIKESIDFKAGKVRPSEYYSHLEDLTHKAGISPSPYQNLFLYIKYVNFSENIDNSKIFEEISKLVQTIKDKLITTSVQRDINSLTYIIGVLKGLSNINLSPIDYDYFKKHRDEFRSKTLAALLRRCTSLSLSYSLPSDEDIASLEQFYSIAHERDNAIIANSLNRLNHDYGATSVILVAGGFHTEGITAILKEKDISYLVVAPNIKTVQERETTYFSLLKDKKLPLQDVLNDPDTLQIINSITDPQARQVLIDYWVARASRYYSIQELRTQLHNLSLSAEDTSTVNSALDEISPAGQNISTRDTSGQVSSPAEIKNSQDLHRNLPQGVPQISYFGFFLASAKDALVSTVKGLKKNLRKTFVGITLVFASFFSQSAHAHYFTPVPEAVPQAVVQVWDKAKPAENTLGGIGRDILVAQGKQVTSQALYGKGGIVEALTQANNFSNVQVLHPAQKLNLPNLSSETQKHLLKPEEKAANDAPVKVEKTSSVKAAEQERQAQDATALQNELNSAKEQNKQAQAVIEKLQSERNETAAKIISLEEKNKVLEEDSSAFKDRLKAAQDEASQLRQKAQDFDHYSNQWWHDLGSGWKFGLSLLGAMGIGIGITRLYLQRRWIRLRQLNENIAQKREEKERLDREIEAADKALNKLKQDNDTTSRSLAESESKCKTLEERIKELENNAEESKVRARLRQEIDQLTKDKESLDADLRQAQEKGTALAVSLAAQEKEESERRQRIAGLKDEIINLERDIQALQYAKSAQEVLVKEAESLAKAQIDEINKRLEATEGVLSNATERVALLKAQEKDLDSELSAHQNEKKRLQSEIDALSQQQRNLSQEIGGIQTRKEQFIKEGAEPGEPSLDKDIVLKQKKLAELNTRVSGLTVQVSSLNQEIAVLTKNKQTETHNLESLAKEKESLEKDIGQARSQIAEASAQLQSLLLQVEELEERGVNLNDGEISALTRKRDELNAELQEIEKSKQQLEDDVRRMHGPNVQIQPVELPKPYSAMLFDIDNTLTPVTTEIDSDLLSVMLDFLSSGVHIALVTAQSMDEVKRHIIQVVPKEQDGLLSNLSVYPSGGAKCFVFDKEGNPVNDTAYDATAGLIPTTNPAEVEAAIRKIVKGNAGIGFRDGLITITGLNDRDEVLGKLTALFSSEGWHLVPRIGGRHTIHVLIGGVDKARAVTHFIKQLEEKTFLQRIPTEQILAAGDSFGGGGLDADFIIALPGSHILSVGRKPQGSQIRELSARGVVFSEDIVGTRDWQATYKILLEIKKGKTIKEIGKDTNGSGVNKILRSVLILALSGLSFFSPLANADAVSGAVKQAKSGITQMSEQDKAVVKQAVARARVEELAKSLNDQAKRDELTDKLAAFGVPAVGPLLEGMGRHDYRTADINLEVFHKACQEAIEKMGWDRRVAEVLIEVAKDKSRDIYVSWAAMRQLAKFGNQDAIDTLDKILTTDKRGVNPDAAGLGWRGAMHEAAQCLANIGSERAIMALRNATHNEDERVRQVADDVLKEKGIVTQVSLADIFTEDNYRNDIQKISEAINTMTSTKSYDEKNIASLVWVVSEPTLPDNKFYPDVTKNAAIALLNSGSDGQKALAEALKDKKLIDRGGCLKAVLKAISENKSDSALIADALEWIVFEAYQDEKTCDTDIIKSATIALIHMGNEGVSRLVKAFNEEAYQNINSMRISVVEAIGEAGVNNERLNNKLYWLVLEASFMHDGAPGYYHPPFSKAAAVALYHIQGEGVIKKLTDALSGDTDWRKRDGAAEGIVGIASSQEKKITPKLKAALEKVVALGHAHDYRETAVNEAKELLGKNKPDSDKAGTKHIEKPVKQDSADSIEASKGTLSSEMYQKHPEKVIQYLKERAHGNGYFTEDLKKIIFYTNADGTVNAEIVKEAVSALFSWYTGRKELAKVFTSENYQQHPANLVTLINLLDSSALDGNHLDDNKEFLQALSRMVVEPSSGGKYIPDINAAAAQKLITLCKAGATPGVMSPLSELFRPENYYNKPAQLALAADVLAANKDGWLLSKDKLIWAIEYKGPDGLQNSALVKSALRALAEIIKDDKTTPDIFIDILSHPDEEIRNIAMEVLTSRKGVVDSGKITRLLHSDNLVARAAAREVLGKIDPHGAEGVFLSADEARKELFSYRNHNAAAEALREFSKEKPFKEKAPVYLLSYLANAYIWLIAGLGIGSVIIAGIVLVRRHQVNIIYRKLLDYAGKTTFRERRTLRAIAVSLAREEDYSFYDATSLIARSLPAISQTSKIKHIEKLSAFLDKLNKARLNSQYILEHWVPLVSKIAGNDAEFDKGLTLLEDLAVTFQQQNSDIRSIGFESSNVVQLIDNFVVFQELCAFAKDSVLKNKQAVNELLTVVVPDAFKGAKDDNARIARLQIIRQLVLGGLHPTQLLIEVLEKTTSQSRPQQLAQWNKLLSEFKSGIVHFDVNNPLHIDLEYNTYRQLAPQVSLSTSYNDYKGFIKKFHSSTGPGSSLGNQEAGEIRLAVYEAMRLLEFIIAVKQKADKLGRPVWIVPNKSYGGFAVSPIVDELAMLGIEVHYTKIGSTESHENPTVFNQSLFSDDIYLRILKEQPILIAVDGTQHTAARAGDGKASRYPDAYQGYRNFVVALDEVLCQRKEEKFVDQVLTLDRDHLSNLRKTPAYVAFIDRLERLTSGASLPTSIYRLEFWNPGGRNLILRENRKEVVWENKKFTPFDISSLNSPTLIFVSCSMLDEDIPPDIKKWSGLEGAHQPAFFDDKGQIQQNALAINGRGLYLTHALEFEITRASQQLKGFYKGKLPQIEYKEPTPDDIRGSYEAMLFDLDGTLTDTLKDIDASLLDRLLYFMGSGVLIAVVTSQSLDEVKKHVLDKVSADKRKDLGNLFLYASRGAQIFNFDSNGTPILLHDRTQTDLNDAQRLLIRQVVNQALGSLLSDTEIIDRQAQLTIHLKDKNKRDLVNTTLAQLITSNNLPFQTEYSGNSTIHVVLKGTDKGAARDNFLKQVFPSRVSRAADISKLLIVGDRFAAGGSDQPMILQGARVVSVGKEKGLPASVENYPAHGWRGTNQLLGEIVYKAGRTTVSSPAAFFTSLSLTDLWHNFNTSLDGLYDVSKRPLLYAGIAFVGLAFLFLSATAGIKFYKTYRLYSKLAGSLSFLTAKDKFYLFREASRYVSWRRFQEVDPYQVLVKILPGLSNRVNDVRLAALVKTADSLQKAKLNPRHVFKYMLPAISAKSRDEKSFLSSLALADKFTRALQDKKYDYHQMLREILPAVNKATSNIEEFNEALAAGTALAQAGRNPKFALTVMLPEVASLARSIAEFRLGMYALQQLCIQGFEPTRYLISELIKEGNQSKIDKALSCWQDIRHKFKTGEVSFDPKNELYVNLEYTTFRELVDRTLKQAHRYSFAEYKDILNNFNQDKKGSHIKGNERAEIKYAAYEAYRLHRFITDVKRQADKMGRPVWVVPNLSYGRFAVSPLLKDLAAEGIEIHYARIGSTESHNNPELVKADLFNAALYDRIINEQPVIIVVDGTEHTAPRPKDGKSGRYPDAYVGYRNMIIAVNDIITNGKEQLFKQLVKTRGKFIQGLRKKSDYRTLRRRMLRLFKADARIKRFAYAVEFWNPGGLNLAVRESRHEVNRVASVSANQITQPTLIFVNSAILDGDVPLFIHEWVDKEKKIRHKPAYFDDTSHIQNLIFNVDSSGVSLSDSLNRRLYKEYKRIKGIYRPMLNLPAKPQNLAKLPYKAVISDLDGTLTDTLQEVPKPVMEKLLYLLSLGVQVAIVTTQSYKEVERYLLSQVPSQNKVLLSNLTIYPATGSQGFGFDRNGDPIPEPLFDSSSVKLSEAQMQRWRQVITALLQEYGLDKDVKDKKSRIIATPAKVIDAGSQIIVRLKERGFLRGEILKRLQSALEREQLPISLKQIGSTSIRMTINGVDKSMAVNYHLSRVCKDRFGFEPKPSEVLILGNSFDEGGDDRDMMIKGAKVFSVGHKPAPQLRKGIYFYSTHSWQGSDQVLSEFINILPAKQDNPAKPQGKGVTVNSFSLPSILLAGGLLEGTDPYVKWFIGCAVVVGIGVYLLWNKIFPKEKAEPEDTEPLEKEYDAGPIISQRSIRMGKPLEAEMTRGQPSVNKRNEILAVKAAQIRNQYPGIRVGVIGATAPTPGYSSSLGERLGRKLRSYIENRGFVFTGGVSGVGVDVYRGVVNESKNQDDRFFVLLPDGMFPGSEYRNISRNGTIKVANIGEDMFERRIGMGEVADVLIVLNGRGGTLHEAVSALEMGKKVIALNYGGAGSILHYAKARNKLSLGLMQEGIKQEHLQNIILSDIDNIGDVLGSLSSSRVSSRSEILDSDSFSNALLAARNDSGETLSRQAVYAVNSLNAAYKGITLEVDADTLIDTSKGAPQLKGLGFREAIASLYQAQEKKQIPDNLHVRIININPDLDRRKIIKVLGLGDDVLEGMVSIPDIPQDYLVKTLEPYLISGSIRVIFEDNARYWGKKIDVVVRRGSETQTLSSLGLIVASLAKEPKFYAQLPKEMKEYIVAKTDEHGNVELDDEGKIKQLIFKPIEKEKVDTRYLEQLDKANKELEGMV